MGNKEFLLICATGLGLGSLSSFGESIRWISPGQGGAARISAVSAQYIATGGDDGSIHLWNLDTHKFIKSLPGHTGAIHGLAFSPGGDSIASASADGTVRLDQIASGTSATIIATPAYAQTGVAFQSQSNRLVTVSITGDLSFWNLSDHSLAGKISTGSSATALAFAPSGQYAALASSSQINLVSLADGSIRALAGHTEVIQTLAFSPDSATLATGAGSPYTFEDPAGSESINAVGGTVINGDATIRIWDVATGEQTGALKAHTAGIRSVAFAPNPNNLVSVGFDHRMIAWDLLTGKPIGAKYLQNPEALSISTDAKWIVSGSQILDVAQQTLSDLDTHVLPIQSLAFSRDGAYLVSDDSLEPRLWDARTGALVQNLAVAENTPHPAAPGSAHIQRNALPISFSPDGQTLLAIDRLWNLETGAALERLPRTAQAVSPDWQNFVTASSESGTVAERFSFPGGDPIDTLSSPYTRSSSALAFSPAGTLIASAGGYKANSYSIDATLKIWNATNAVSARQLANDQTNPNAIAFSADDQYIAASSERNGAALNVWNLANNELILRLADATSAASAFAFFPNSARIAWGHGGGVEIWNLVTGARERTLTNELYNITALAIAPDGLSLAAGRMDGTVLVVPVTEEPIQVIGEAPHMNTFTFNFPTRVGVSYTVQATSDFQTWEDRETFTATATNSATVFNSVKESGFLRLRQN